MVRLRQCVSKKIVGPGVYAASRTPDRRPFAQLSPGTPRGHDACLPDGYRAAIFGASGGIGGALVDALCEDPRCSRVFALARRAGAEATQPRITSIRFDLEDEASIAQAASEMRQDGALHLVVVATGMLHDGPLQPEKSGRALRPETLARAFAINATGPAIIARHLLPVLSRTEKAVFAALSARVGSISDNHLGGWHAYRASKASLNMLVRTFAIELARTHPAAVCIALHPGTVETALSKPFLANAAGAKRPENAAAQLLRVIDTVTPNLSGHLIGWDGVEIQP
jgi:NAD(P)-dependent dehydrogenase (short-subunit alcohol dehydrogenase family)